MEPPRGPTVRAVRAWRCNVVAGMLTRLKGRPAPRASIGAPVGRRVADLAGARGVMPEVDLGDSMP
jgi:hypothetical protein